MGRLTAGGLACCLVATLAVACGSGQPQWEKDLVTLVCNSIRNLGRYPEPAVYRRPPFLIETTAGQRELDLAEESLRSRRLSCGESAIPDSIATEDIRFVGVLPHAARDDSWFVAVSETSESPGVSWLRVPKGLVDEAEPLLGHSFAWTDVPVSEYSGTELGKPDLTITFEQGSLGVLTPGVPCAGPSTPITVNRGHRVKVTSDGPGALTELRIAVDGVPLSFRFRRPMEPYESFSFYAPAYARVELMAGGVSKTQHVPPSESVTVECGP